MICSPDAERTFEVPFWVLDDRWANRETPSEAARDGLRSTGEGTEGLESGMRSVGAVLGLIQVMRRLRNINEGGKGIAVAFVATIYGVGSANLFFLPCAGKLRIRLREKQVIQEVMLEAVLAIVEGVNPRAVELRLNSFATTPPKRWLRDFTPARLIVLIKLSAYPRGVPLPSTSPPAARRILMHL
jgi:hypothetical protein